MVMESHNQVCSQLREITERQKSCCELVDRLDFKQEDSDDKHNQQDCTVMLECLYNDVDHMRRTLKEYNDHRKELNPCDILKSAVEMGYINQSNHNDGTGDVA